MQVREATADDGAAIREVAEASLEASYSLSPAAIEAAVVKWYDGDAIAEKLDDDDVLLLVADDGGEVVGFTESVLVDDRGDLLWLHVDPPHRGRGIGSELWERTREALVDRGAAVVRGHVLADNETGNDFYEQADLIKVDESEVEIDGTAHVENVYADRMVVDLEPVAADDGGQLYVDHADTDRGSQGPFAVVYTDPDRENKWGYYCTACGSLVASMDAMGRMECGSCGNTRKPTRWDAAYM